MNNVSISGNLTRDPELFETKSGTPICKCGVAVIERRKGDDDEWFDVPHFVDFTYFGRRGELMAQKAKKGDLVFISGRLNYSTWEDKDTGKNRSKLDVTAQTVEGEFVFRPSDAASQPAATGAPATDDIPF